MTESHRYAIKNAMAPSNQYITFDSLVSLEANILAISIVDLSDQLHNIRTAIRSVTRHAIEFSILTNGEDCPNRLRRDNQRNRRHSSSLPLSIFFLTLTPEK
jgi:hypothetical protein